MMPASLNSIPPHRPVSGEYPKPVPAESGRSQAVFKSEESVSYRVLIVDDNPAIHEDFRKILCSVSDEDAAADELESLIFGSQAKTESKVTFELDSAFQGQSALEKIKEALSEGRPYALAFVDVQMPPGWDGVTTVNHLWEVDPGLQVVICTAYSSYSWKDMRSVLKQTDSLLILKKPFDQVEIQQMAHTLVRKWELNLQADRGLSRLDDSIRNLLAGAGEPAADAWDSSSDASPSARSDELQFVANLQRLGQKLEWTRGQLRQAEQQLVHSEKMASLGRLSAGILHEINNPLNYTMAALTLLEHDAKRLPDDLREDHQETLKDIRDGCTRMMEITGSLRQFAHPEPAEPRPVRMNDAVRTAVRLMAAEIGDDIVIENRIPDNVSIWGAASRLTQVFINLIHNATHALRLKHHEAGAVPRILFEAEAAEGITMISVTDNGTGISAGDIGKVFDPFYTTKEIGQGTGLGLGICHQILKQFGGRIAVRSEPGIQTRFELSFPHPDF